MKENNKLFPNFNIEDMASQLDILGENFPAEGGINLPKLMAQLTRKNARFQLTQYKGKSYFASEYFSDIEELKNAKKVSVDEFIKDTKQHLWSDVKKMVLIPLK